jgi:hypothetical protein
MWELSALHLLINFSSSFPRFRAPGYNVPHFHVTEAQGFNQFQVPGCTIHLTLHCRLPRFQDSDFLSESASTLLVYWFPDCTAP